MRRWLLRGVVLAVLVLAGAGLWSAAATPSSRTLEDRTGEVAQTLRCPSCAGESVADSAAPLAGAMRLVVSEQLQQGRSPEQIRSWFAERYGDGVLLDPPRSGVGWLVWGLPVVLVGAAVALGGRRLVAGHRGLVGVAAVGVALAVAATWSLPSGDPPPVLEAREPVGVDRVALLEHAVAEEPGDLSLQLALARTLDDEARTGEAVEHYAAAARLRPRDADVTYYYAFALARWGAEADAVAVLEDTLTVEPEHAPSLLLLGTILERAGDVRGGPLLERFLALEPAHPAAAEVRALLTAPADGGGS